METEIIQNKKPGLVPTKLNIQEVTTNKQLKEFIQLPLKIYNKNSRYVMPPNVLTKDLLKFKNKKQKHLLLAYLGKEAVARLAVKVHTVEDETRLHFGFFECDPKHPEAAKALVDRAHSFYPELEMIGPFHFRQEDPYIGVLVEGFEQDPYFMMSYNHPEYDKFLTSAGMSKAMDLYTYILKNPAHHKDSVLPELIKDNSKKARENLNLSFRQLDAKNLKKEARIIAGIFNEALSENWGFEEFLDSQIDEMVFQLKFFLDPRMIVFALHEGKEVGCLVMIPNYNHIIKPSWGKIDLGLISRYLNRKKTTNSIRGYALGVLKKYHGKGVGSAITEEMFNVGAKTNYALCEISWVLASNGPMNELSQAMGGLHNKVYRIYKKQALSHKSN
ncbi:MAG: hypothetical protein IPM57_07710 [Oligoflexia bacterium]|nr:hypothetical protein [Oligoflexia bacterium]